MRSLYYTNGEDRTSYLSRRKENNSRNAGVEIGGEGAGTLKTY